MARFVVQFLKDVLGENGHEAEVCQSYLEIEAANRPRCCFGATPLVAELPRSNGQTTAWPSAPSRAKGEERG